MLRLYRGAKSASGASIALRKSGNAYSGTLRLRQTGKAQVVFLQTRADVPAGTVPCVPTFGLPRLAGMVLHARDPRPDRCAQQYGTPRDPGAEEVSGLRTINSASRVRFCPPPQRTFGVPPCGFFLRPTGMDSTYSRPVLAARGNLGVTGSRVKGSGGDCRNLRLFPLEGLDGSPSGSISRGAVPRRIVLPRRGGAAWTSLVPYWSCSVQPCSCCSPLQPRRTPPRRSASPSPAPCSRRPGARATGSRHARRRT